MSWISSPYLSVFITAMLPISELRGAIPLGLQWHQLGVFSTFAISVLGNLIPVVLILWFIFPVSTFLRKRSRLMDAFFAWLFARTRRHGARFDRWGPFALLIFVAIPLPFTGAWTGALAAFLFGIRARIAIPILFLGILIAGIIVTLMTLGIVSLF